MDDFNRLATLDEIETHYASLDVPIPICWLLNGKLDYLEEETEVQVTFTKGEIRDKIYDITATYTLMRYENGYMVYSILAPVTDIEFFSSAGTALSDWLFYDVEIPAHFTETPSNSCLFGKTSGSDATTVIRYNYTHLVDYMPEIQLEGVNSAAAKTSGYLVIRMEGF